MAYEIDKSELGEKLYTKVVHGSHSLKAYENGVEIKMYGQERIRISEEDVRHLSRSLELWDGRKELFEEDWDE